MSIATKLETVTQSCKNIRETLNAQNSKLGDGSIITLGDEIRNCPKMAIVYKEGNEPVKSKIVFGDSQGNLPSMSALNNNVPHTIVSAIIPKCNASPSFSQQKYLERLYFEDGTTSIGFCEGCTSLKKVYLPEGITTLMHTVFKNCVSIQDMYLPTTLTSIAIQGTNVMNIHIKDIIKYAEMVPASGYIFANDTPHKLFLNDEELTDIIIPSTTTRIGRAAFNYMQDITSISIENPNIIIDHTAFANCSKLHNLTIPSGVTFNTVDQQGAYNVFNNAGDGTGTLKVLSNQELKFRQSHYPGNWRHMYFAGNVIDNTVSFCTHLNFESLRIQGNLTTCSYGISYNYNYGPSQMRFVEIMGTLTSSDGYGLWRSDSSMYLYDGCILHLGYNGIATSPTLAGASFSRLHKIYVGDGSSQEHDNAILQQYLADDDWVQYSDKLDIWYNYHGYYRTSDFEPLNYVATDSSAYTDTGISGDNNNLKIKIQFSVDTRTSWKGWVGNHNNNTNRSWRIRWSDANGKLCANVNSKSDASGNNIIEGLTLSDIHTIELTRSSCKLDSNTTSITNTETGNANTNNILLGIDSTSDAPADLGLKIYSFSIYNGNTLVCDYIPCLRKSDDAVGFWDHVTQTFKQSITESPFVAGPSIN